MGFSPIFSLLMLAFALLHAPPVLPLWLRRVQNAPLPLSDTGEPAASVARLSPLTLSAQSHVDQSAVTHCLKDGCF